MAIKLEYENDKSGSLQEAKGSDGRLNTSSRSDPRGYYNSRDEGLAFTWVFNHPVTAPTEWSFTLQNISVNKTLVISSIGFNCDVGARVALRFATGISGGTAMTGTNLNSDSANTLTSRAAALHDNGGTDITAASGDIIDELQVGLLGHEEFRLNDRIRLGQDKAIGLIITSDETSNASFGVVFGYYE